MIKYFEIIHFLDKLAIPASLIFIIWAVTYALVIALGGIMAFATALGSALLAISIGWIIAGILIGIILGIIFLLSGLDDRKAWYAFKTELSWKT